MVKPERKNSSSERPRRPRMERVADKEEKALDHVADALSDCGHVAVVHGCPRCLEDSKSPDGGANKRIRRQGGARAAKSCRAINASVADLNAQLSAANDVIIDMQGCGGEDDPAEKFQNDGDDNARPFEVGDRYYFAPADSAPRWPAFVALSLPALCAIPLMWNGHAGWALVLCVMTAVCQSVVIRLLRPTLRSRSYLNMFRPHITKWFPATVSQCSEFIHRQPEVDLDRPGIVHWLMFLQSLSRVCVPFGTVITGVAYHMGFEQSQLYLKDVRLPNQQGITTTRERVIYDMWAVVPLCTGIATTRVSCETIARQLVPKLQPLRPEDRDKHAESMSSHLCSSQIPGSLYPEVIRGSALLAVAHTTAADVSSRTQSRAYVFAARALDTTWTLLFPLVLLMLLPTDILPASLSIGPFNEVYWALTFGPLIEEVLKSACASATGLPRVVTSALYGMVEAAFRLFQPTAAPALAFHVLSGWLPLPFAVVAHYAFNYALFVPGVIGYFRRGADFAALCAKHAAAADKYHRELIEMLHSNVDFSRCYSASSIEALALIVASIALLSLVGRRGLRARNLACAFGSQLYAVGYQLGEVKLPNIEPYTAKIKLFASYGRQLPRKSYCCALGFVLRRVVPPFPDFGHAPTVLAGALARFCRDPPKVKRSTLRSLKLFVRRYCRKHYIPIPPDADCSVETWLAGTGYPEWRKEQLRQTWNEFPHVTKMHFKNSSFAKKEHYVSYKQARAINSRSDTFKCFSGPYFKLMEEQVYHQECYDGVSLVEGEPRPFIKHIPTHLRPEFIRRMLGGSAGPYYETDYSQFEKHFLPEVMLALELVLYKHMLCHHMRVFDVLKSALAGRNQCCFKDFKVTVAGRRMSGDMCTSLGNGFSNLMLFKFAAFRKGGEAFGVVEGDDALFVSSVPVTKTDFSDLGFDIKIVPYVSLHSTSFCGMCASSDGVMLRDPTRVIPKFGWSFSPLREAGANKRAALLRARALSLAYESPRCPVIHSVAKAALRVTSGVSPRFETNYHSREVQAWSQQFSGRVLEELKEGPSMVSRIEFAEKYGISVPVQLAVEDIFNKWNGQPLDDAQINLVFSPAVDMFDFALRYTSSDKSIAEHH